MNSGNDEPIGDGMSTILRRPRDQQQPMTNGSTSQKWDIEVHSNPVVDEQVKGSFQHIKQYNMGHAAWHLRAKLYYMAPMIHIASNDMEHIL